MGIDAEHGFEPKYITIRGKGDVLAKLRKEVKKADKVYLATDPDREGEAIAWHLAHVLKLPEGEKNRITFNEVTKNAVKNSIKNVRTIDMDLVDAQQARRMLDRMVGYEISPLLWSKIKRGLSAGRVQSVTLRIIADREKEIEGFVPQEYWNLEADFEIEGEKKPLVAKFYGTEKKKLSVTDLLNKYGIELVLLMMIAISTMIEPTFLSIRNLINVLRQISVTGPIALGMTFIIINGNIDLSVGGIVGLAGMAAMIIMSKGGGVLAAVGAAVLIGLFMGAFNGYIVSKGLAPFIVTMSTNTVIRGLAYISTNGQPVWGIAPGYEQFGQGNVGLLPIPVLIFLMLFGISYFILNHTSIGRTVYAVGGNAEASRLSGISILKSKVFVYCVSGFMASVTAIVLTSRLASCDPTIGLDYQVDAIAATVIGGTSMTGGEGKIGKTLIGALIIGFLSNILNLAAISPYIQQVIKGLIILVAVIWDNSRRKKII